MLELTYLETFSNRVNTSWGTLFHNESQPNYYDSNHAHIMEKCLHPQSVVDEVIQYYQLKNLIPRFYIYNLENQQNLLHELKIRNFRYEELVSPVQLWNNQVVNIENSNKVIIEIVTDANYQEAVDMESSITEFGGKETIEQVFKEQFHHPSYTHYLLRYEGKACSTACLFEDGEQARIESVATLEAIRGKSLIGELIRFLQKEVKKRGLKELWVFPINESIEKVYAKYGFQTVAKLTTGHAFREKYRGDP